MKQKKQALVFAVMGIASVVVCALLLLSNAFTGKARAADQAEPTLVPQMVSFPHSLTRILSDTPDPSTPGQWVTVSVSVSGAGPLPTGTVHITGADSDCDVILVDGIGFCDVIFYNKGHRTLRATYDGDGVYLPSYKTASHKVVKASTATTITSDTPDPSEVGQPVVVEVTVNGTGGLPPTGLVVITGANANCSVYITDGIGSCSVVFTSAGSRTLKASYKGDANNKSSSGKDSHFVNRSPSSVLILSDDPDPSIPGQAVKVRVQVLGAAANPTGTVVISGADINCSGSLSGGIATCQVVFYTIGDKLLTATYYGNKNYLPSTADVDHRVENPTTTIITADNLDPSLPGESIQVDVTVSGPGAPPTGTVDITGAEVNCIVSLSGGSGSCNAQFNTAGGKLLRATYNGEDPDYAGSVGTATHTVIRGGTLTTITADDPDPSSPNALVPVTVTVAAVAPGVVTPTGTVALTISGMPSVCTITLVSGTGTCSVVFNSSGVFTITANYSGDNTYLPSVDNEQHTAG